MKIPVNILGWLVAVVLGVIIFFMQTCEKPCPECPEPPVFDTSAFEASLPIHYKDSIVYVPKAYPIYRDTGSTQYVPIPIDIDSLKIVQAYHERWKSVDTIVNDTNAFIVITDVIWKNKIFSRRVFPKSIFPHYKVITKTVTIKEPLRNMFMLGGGVTGNAESVGFSIGAGLLNKKRQVLLLSYDLIRSEVQVQYYIPIRFRK